MSIEKHTFNPKYLIQALKLEKEDTLTCEVCEEQLPDYLQAKLIGQADQATWQAVTIHLAVCPHCATLYHELVDLMAFAQDERSGVSPHHFEPDLSLLVAKKQPTPSEPSPFWRLDQAGRLIIEFSAELIRGFQPPAYAAAGLKKSGADNLLYQMVWQETGVDLEASITVEAQPDDPTRCTITVEVDIPSRDDWLDLADTKVTLKRNEEALATEMTDAFGHALFQNIATDDLPHLVFEIAPQI